jgi:hypothetical protein
MGGKSGVSDTLYFLAAVYPGDATGVDVVGVCPISGSQKSAAKLNGPAVDKYGASCVYSMEAYDP